MLVQALRSVLQQTYRNLEIVVHDNNSSDGTEAELRRIFSDPRILYRRVNRDLTMQENWNAAFQYVRGEYFVRLDDDNVLLQDFVDSALHEMQRFNGSAITFSPLSIGPDRALSCFFTPESSTHLLNPYQLLYLEYFNLTDSNYTMYKTELIRKIFPDGHAYRGALPDRFMNYCIAHYMEGKQLRVGINTALKGVTRFDYRPLLPADYTLHYVDYADVEGDRRKQEIDYQGNFNAHRIATIKEFFETYHDKDLRAFFSSTITDERLFPAVLHIGHIAKIKSVHSVREAVAYIQHISSIIRILFRYPFSMVEGRRAWLQIIIWLRNIARAYFSSFISRVGGARRKSLGVVDAAFGNSIVESVLKGVPIQHYWSNIKAMRGSLQELLMRIQWRPTVR